MPSSTIRLTEDLKVRVAAAAERAGVTVNDFIVDTLAHRIGQLERRAAFNDLGQQRYGAVAASGETIAWPDMCRYLEARLAGQSPPRPQARKSVQ